METTPKSLLAFVARFALVLMALQLAWGQARGPAIERAVIDKATVGATVGLIHLLRPELPVHGQGSRIVAPGGGLNVLNGCEGTEALFLLFAALAAGRMSMRARLAGCLLGTAWIFALNQLRLIGLFFTYRQDRALFDQLHGLIAPLLLVALVLLFFLELLRWDARRSAVALPGAED